MRRTGNRAASAMESPRNVGMQTADFWLLCRHRQNFVGPYKPKIKESPVKYLTETCFRGGG